jgi:Domain of unknown function (DUF4397)
MMNARAARRIVGLGSAILTGSAAVVAGLLAFTAPAASAATQSVGWIQLAHLSPNTPAVDVYLYSFGNPKAELVLHHVAYGTVSPFEQLAAGDYTVAMRAAGASAGSKPVLSTAVDIAAGHAYTVAGMGPAAGLRLQIIPDKLSTPPGKALVRIIQASLQQNVVTVTADGTTLARGLRFAKVTGYVAVAPGTWTVKAAGSSESATRSVTLAAGSIHTLVILDEPGTLAIDDLLEAAASQQAPIGSAQTGLGGTAARPGLGIRSELAATAVGALLLAGGLVVASRRRRPARHARGAVNSV